MDTTLPPATLPQATPPCQRALPIGLRYITDDLRDFLLALFPEDRPGVFVENIGLGGERETDSISEAGNASHSITVYFHGEALKGQAHFIEDDKPAGMVSGKIEVEVRYLSPTGENVIGEVYDESLKDEVPV